MRSTPTKSFEANCHFLPLHQTVQLEAVKSALRLNRHKNFLDENLTGHIKILKNFHINELIVRNEDWLENKPNFDTPYKIIETERESWETGGPAVRQGSIIFYTDGSKMNKATGAGITGPGINEYISMGNWPTVFQAEIYVIMECAYICLKRNYRHANICIFSDSQAALKALKAPICKSKLVWECILSFRQLAQKKTGFTILGTRTLRN